MIAKWPHWPATVTASRVTAAAAARSSTLAEAMTAVAAGKVMAAAALVKMRKIQEVAAV
jgi:hypothetical protein